MKDIRVPEVSHADCGTKTGTNEGATKFEYENDEWDTPPIGDLIIDLDADIEKNTEREEARTASVERSSAKGIKLTIKRSKTGSRAVEAKHVVVQSENPDENRGKATRRNGSVSRKRERSRERHRAAQENVCVNGTESPGGDLAGVKTEAEPIDAESDQCKKAKVDKMKTSDEEVASSSSTCQEMGTGTSLGTTVEPDYLGPCEPGTSVALEGIVWHETEGVLVVNITWRGKTYVGTLLDCTRQDWAPPNFCDSPTSDLDLKSGKNRSKKSKTSSSASNSHSDSPAETRSSVKLRSTGKGRKNNPGSCSFTAPPSPAKSESSKRKSTRVSDADVGSPQDSRKRGRSSSRSTPTSCTSPTPEAPSSPVLIECPAPNCGKKYRHVNGLRYHQTHAHRSGGENGNREASESEDSPSGSEKCIIKMEPSLLMDIDLSANDEMNHEKMDAIPEKSSFSDAVCQSTDDQSSSAIILSRPTELLSSQQENSSENALSPNALHRDLSPVDLKSHTSPSHPAFVSLPQSSPALQAVSVYSPAPQQLTTLQPVPHASSVQQLSPQQTSHSYYSQSRFVASDHQPISLSPKTQSQSNSFPQLSASVSQQLPCQSQTYGPPVATVFPQQAVPLVSPKSESGRSACSVPPSAIKTVTRPTAQVHPALNFSKVPRSRVAVQSPDLLPSDRSYKLKRNKFKEEKRDEEERCVFHEDGEMARRRLEQSIFDGREQNRGSTHSPAYSDISDAGAMSEPSDKEDDMDDKQSDPSKTFGVYPYYPGSFLSQTPDDPLCENSDKDKKDSRVCGASPFAYFGFPFSYESPFHFQRNAAKEEERESSLSKPSCCNEARFCDVSQNVVKHDKKSSAAQNEGKRAEGSAHSSSRYKTLGEIKANPSQRSPSGYTKPVVTSVAKINSGRRDSTVSKETRTSERCKPDGVRANVESRGSPSALVGGYVHPAFVSPSSFAVPTFDNSSPIFRPVNPILLAPPYSGNSYISPSMRYLSSPDPQDLSSKGPKALDLLQYFSNHKIHELQERSIRPPSRSAASSRCAPSVSNPTTKMSEVNCLNLTPPPGNDLGRSPPAQRHVHTHHHTHVGLGYPIQYSPHYGTEWSSSSPTQQSSPLPVSVLSNHPAVPAAAVMPTYIPPK